MKLIILKNKLLEALVSVERAISFSSNLNILKSIFIKTNNNKIDLVSTNLEIAIKHTTSCKIEKAGELVIPFSTINNIVKNLNEERITMNLKDKKLIISTDNYEAVLQTENPSDFPIIPEVGKESKLVNIKNFTLQNFLGDVLVAAQYSEIRPEISGVFFRYRNDNFVLVATDSFRLTEKKVELNNIESRFDSFEFILPMKAAEEFLKVFKDEEKVQLFIDENQVVFMSEKKEMISRLIDGTFPDYESVIPKDLKNEAEIELGEFINALKLTGVLAGRNNDVTISVGENKKFVEIYAVNAIYGENKYRIPAKLKGGKFSVMFNWRYLLDGLKVYKNESIILGVNSKETPAIIRDPKDKSQIYVLMPIKI